VIEERIAQAEARITGTFSVQEAADLALILRSGALPASLSYLEERLVGPTLGEASVRAGSWACWP
jgi:preprotein translocase subunit SecD